MVQGYGIVHGMIAFGVTVDRSQRPAALSFAPQLAPYKYPRRVRFVPELPKTATGKIQRFRLRELTAGKR